MTTVHRWTGRETRALRQALRMSVRAFSAHLGVAERTVSKWEAGQDGVRPRPEMQAALDTTLSKADAEARDRFMVVLHATGPPPAAVGTAQADLAMPEQRSEPQPAHTLADLTAVYPNRSQLSAQLPPDQFFGCAKDIRAVGLSLNMLCQGYADRRWQTFLTSGGRVRCLFLDPGGSAIEAREVEEGFPAGHLSALTRLNIETLARIRDRLPADSQDSMSLATYDETLRFNILLVDDLCVAQPYLADSRGVDSPAFVMTRTQPDVGLYPVFERIFESYWQRRRTL